MCQSFESRSELLTPVPSHMGPVDDLSGGDRPFGRIPSVITLMSLEPLAELQLQ